MHSDIHTRCEDQRLEPLAIVTILIPANQGFFLSSILTGIVFDQRRMEVLSIFEPRFEPLQTKPSPKAGRSVATIAAE